MLAEHFVDASPAAVDATFRDEGTYLASERTMYRFPATDAEVRAPGRSRPAHTAGHMFVSSADGAARLDRPAFAVISYSSVVLNESNVGPVRRRAWKQLLFEVITYTRARADIAQR